MISFSVDLKLWRSVARAGNVVTLKVRNRDQDFTDELSELMSTPLKDQKKVLVDLKEASLKDHIVADRGSYLHRYN